MYTSIVGDLCSKHWKDSAIRDSVEESNLRIVHFILRQGKWKGLEACVIRCNSCRPRVENERLEYGVSTAVKHPAYFQELTDTVRYHNTFYISCGLKYFGYSQRKHCYNEFQLCIFSKYACVCVCTVYMPVSVEARGHKSLQNWSYGQL